MAQSTSFSLVPSLAVSETATDNRDLRSGDSRRSELITQVSPGFALNARRGLLQGTVNYALNGLIHARDSSENSVQHQLMANGQLVMLDGRFGVKSAASASMQTISAYGTQSADPSLNSSNQTQTFSYSIAPYLTGRLLGSSTYRAEVGYEQTRTGNDGIGNTASLNTSIGMAGRMGGTIGWSIDATRRISEIADRPRAHEGSLVAGLSYTPDVDWQFNARAGSETSDLKTGQSERSTTWGAGLTWLPGPRTSVRANFDHRYFGRSYSVAFSHRMARSVWTLSDSRTINLGGAKGREVVTWYDFAYAQFPHLAPSERDTAARALLRALNHDATEPLIVGGFLNSTATIQRQQVLSFLYTGLRSTTAVSLTRSLSSAFDGSDAGSSAQIAPAQTALSIAWSHRLTPDATLAIAASQQNTRGNGIQAANDLRSVTVTWSSALGRYSNVSLGLRHTQFDSETNPYTESAVLGSIRMQF